jgi:hypothetical protein
VNDFIIKVFLPLKKQYYTFKEIKYSTYKNLAKTILNNNNADISIFFNNLILIHSNDKQINFNFLEKLIILLALRIICVSPVLEFNIQDKNKKQQLVSVDLSKLLQNIQNIDFDDKEVQFLENIEVNFSLPSNLFYNTLEEHYLSTIKSVIINKTVYDVNDSKILDSLPTSTLKYAKELFDKINNSISKYFLIKIFFGENENLELPLSLKDNTIIEFLKILFKRDLLSLYEFEYFFISKLNLTYDLLHNSTPAELNVFMNIYKKDLEERNKQQQGNNLNLQSPNLNKINE